ncbi:T6SS immunity protein Tdi1 domain-containing protein [Flavobacterium sp. RHBU_3]|uniref:T6SS immunity protein Tdi1 domain-containing protein n=1 Tax=Flavobacterium sp. RHBU_3 TaxID=3391184 RepID=UPI003985405B
MSETNEVEIIAQQFFKRSGEGEKYSNIPQEIIEKYKGVFVINRGKDDIINYLWVNYGLCKYRQGLFWLINPEEYNNVARKFPGVSRDAIAFARKNLGNLFLFEKLDIGDTITYLNTHTSKISVASTNFEIFIEFNIASDSFWKEDCYGKIELKALKKAPLAPDECYTFVPALALGGDEKLANLQKVKIKENLEFLSQLL